MIDPQISEFDDADEDGDVVEIGHAEHLRRFAAISLVFSIFF